MLLDIEKHLPWLQYIFGCSKIGNNCKMKSLLTKTEHGDIPTPEKNHLNYSFNIRHNILALISSTELIISRKIHFAYRFPRLPFQRLSDGHYDSSND